MMTIGNARQAVTDAAARAEFYRLWLAAQRMGATHVHALEMMGPRETSSSVEAVRTALLKETKQRRTVTSIVETNAALFQPFEAAILKAGDESGGLEKALGTLSRHFKAEHTLLTKVWSKLTYPLIVSLAFIVLSPLPLFFMGRSGEYWIAAIGGLGLWYGFGGGVVVAMAERYANRRDFVLARLARALAGAVEAGLPLDRAASLAADSTGSPAIVAHVKRQDVRTLATQPLSQTFAGCSVVPVEMIAAMRVAEVSGDFSGALRKLADLHDVDFSSLVRRQSANP